MKQKINIKQKRVQKGPVYAVSKFEKKRRDTYEDLEIEKSDIGMFKPVRNLKRKAGKHPIGL